jgi:hypothetical protein
LHLRIIVEFDLPPAYAPNDPPSVFVRELSKRFVAYTAKTSQLSWMRDEVFGTFCKSFCDDASHWLKCKTRFFGHGTD